MSTTRRHELDRERSRGQSNDKIHKKLCRRIKQGEFIPIIGDTIRIGHIFDIDFDNNIGLRSAKNGAGSKKDRESIVKECTNGKKEAVIDIEKLTVNEELAYNWARSDDIQYPLADGFRISRVAQYHSLIEGDRITAIEDYVDFLKSRLLKEADKMACVEGDNEEIAYIRQLEADVHKLSFSDIVTELDFPQFPDRQGDPLSFLAQLPLKIYITTSYHNFLERELEAAGKQPRSLFCFWNMKPETVPAEFRFIPDEDNTSVERPVVYHLLGIEQIPETMVLSEDDYLDILWELARNAAGDNDDGSGIILPYLEDKLKESSLLLLGYRMHDWDLRVLFRGLLNARQEGNGRERPSTAIQFNLEQQRLVKDIDDAEVYLRSYFQQANLEVRFGNSDDFIDDLWQEWQRWR